MNFCVICPSDHIALDTISSSYSPSLEMRKKETDVKEKKDDVGIVDHITIIPLHYDEEEEEKLGPSLSSSCFNEDQQTKEEEVNTNLIDAHGITVQYVSTNLSLL